MPTLQPPRMEAITRRFLGARRLCYTAFMSSKEIDMTKIEATAEVFWTAFNSLPAAEKHAVLQRIIRDENLRRDLMDLALIEERRNEPARPLREYLKEKSN